MLEAAFFPASIVTVDVRTTRSCLLSSAAVNVRHASVPSSVSVDARMGLSAHVSFAYWGRCEIRRYFTTSTIAAVFFFFSENNVPAYFKRCTFDTRRDEMEAPACFNFKSDAAGMDAAHQTLARVLRRSVSFAIY